MKFTQAPKKMLLTGLSAAMVVAFAPAVVAPAAQAKANDNVTISFDADGGALVQGAGGSAAPTQTAKEGSPIVLPSVTQDAHGFKQDASTPWYRDLNNNGRYDDGEGSLDGNPIVNGTGGTWTVPVKQDGSYGELGLKAHFDRAALGDPTYSADKDTITASVSGLETLPENTTARVVLTGGPYSAATEIDSKTVAKGTADVSLTDQNQLLPAGTYTVTLKAKPANGAEYVLGSRTITLATLSLYDINGTKDQDVTYNVATGYDFGDALYATSRDGADVVTQEQTKGFTGTQRLYKIDADFSASASYDDATGRVTGTLKSSDGTYKVKLVNPAGVTIYTTSGSFDYDLAGAGQQSMGTWTVTVTKEKQGSNPEKTLNFQAFTLYQVTYTAGDGVSFPAGTATTAWTSNGVAAAPAAQASAKFGYDPKITWTLNGAAFQAGQTRLDKTRANAYVATATAYDPATIVGAPTVTFAAGTGANAGKTLATIASADGGSIVYAVGNEESASPSESYAAPVDVTNATNLDVQAKAVASATGAKVHDSAVIHYVKNQQVQPYEDVVAGPDGASTFGSKVGRTNAFWNTSANVSAAIAAGRTALSGLGSWYEKESGNATVLAQYKALYDAVKADAQAAVSPYAGNAPVIAGDKVYTMSAAQEKAFADAVAAADKAIADAGSKVVGANYVAQAKAVINAANEALNGTVETSLKPEDVTSAKAVTDQIAKLSGAYATVTASNAAAAKADAEAALAAYDKLSDAAKGLVSSADLKKVTDLIDRADAALAAKKSKKSNTLKATASKKTVKYSTVKKKAVKVTLKASKAKGKVTYKRAKTTGAYKKVSVTSKGKVTFKKGAKKGTYKFKVRAAGNASYKAKTVTVSIKVK